MVSFNINSKIFTEEESLLFQNVHIDDNYAQLWSQKDQIVYWINDGDRFSIFNISTRQATDNWVAFPASIQMRWGYLSPALAQMDDYLIITGGQSLDNTVLNKIHVYNISSNLWLPNASLPRMIYGRIKHSCIVHPNNNHLYILGGDGGTGIGYKDEITKLDLNDIHNLDTQHLLVDL